MNEDAKARITKLLEEIAEKLACSYAGKLSVREYKPVYEGFLPGDEPFLYIAEETIKIRQWETRKFLGLMKKKMSKKEQALRIIATVYAVQDEEERNSLGIVLSDYKNRGVFLEHLIRCREEYNLGYLSFHVMH